MAGKGDGLLDVLEQQLGQWRDFMEQVYVGMWEIHNSEAALSLLAIQKTEWPYGIQYIRRIQDE